MEYILCITSLEVLFPSHRRQTSSSARGFSSYWDLEQRLFTNTSSCFLCSRVGFFPQEIGLHRLLQHKSFPWAAVLQAQAAPVLVLAGSQGLPGFFPLLKYIIPETLQPPSRGSALPRGRSIVELSGTASIRHGGSF